MTAYIRLGEYVMMTIESMSAADRPAVRDLLRSHRLPLDGFDDPHVVALVARDGNAVVGSAAIEQYGSSGLLRSVAVSDSHRGQSLGKQLTQAAIALAESRGLTSLYLLTETASAFFPKFGFVPVSRADIPSEVRTSVEFTTACPASAQAFQLPLKGVSRER
jgi:amino-acid N-acetyltransferase